MRSSMSEWAENDVRKKKGTSTRSDHAYVSAGAWYAALVLPPPLDRCRVR